MSSAKKIRVVELGDVSIVRPEPESVPEDWELAYIKYDAETRNNPSEKWLQLVPQTQATDYCRGFIKREDFFTFFETAIAHEEYFDALKNYAPYYFRKEGDPEAPNRRWGVVMQYFKDWWLFTKYDVDRNTHDSLSLLYLIVTNRAKYKYALDGDISRAYALMNKELIEARVNP